MTELRIGFLFNAASYLSKSTSNRTQMILKSYYLMRCKEITNRLPEKQFSKSSRCPHCCVEWNADTEMKVKPIKLTKKQRRRMRLNKKNSSVIRNEEKILKGKILEKTCSFCNHKTICVLETHKSVVPHSEVKKPEVRKEKNKKLVVPTNKTSVCVYSNSKQVFSLTNHNNTLTSIVKNNKKDIKNNKKKKDKFAGLCQKAVLSAINMKQNKEKQNTINLFLKPSA